MLALPPMSAAAPRSASSIPRRKARLKRSRRNTQAPRETKIGDMLAMSEPLATVVYFMHQDQAAALMAKRAPAAASSPESRRPWGGRNSPLRGRSQRDHSQRKGAERKRR